MRAPYPWLGLLGTLALAGLPAPASAQAVGSEFQVNTYTTGTQNTPSFSGQHWVAADASGNFVVVWQGHGQDGSGVFGQRYDSGGFARGDEFQVTLGGSSYPSVASDATGNFVVVWEGDDGDSPGILGQRYDSEGVAQGDEFIVNTYTLWPQWTPDVASDTHGNFVVVWGSFSETCYCSVVRGRRYESGGVARGDEFEVGSSKGFGPSVASDATGNFVVVWENLGQDGSSYGVFGQRFNRAGGTMGGQFRVNSYTTGGQRAPSVTSDASGNFVVVWQSGAQDGSGDGIFGQRYNSGGVPLGSEFRVNSYTTNSQSLPSVASDASGNFGVVWHSDAQDGNGVGVFGQRYDSAGVAKGNEFLINSFTTSNQSFPSVAVTGTNQFVVAWTSDGQDGSGDGVFGQRLKSDTVTIVSPNTNVTWRIGSQHRIQWAHNLGAGETFRIDLDRDNDGTYEELIAAAAPASAIRGTFSWTVTGPPSGTARVRVSWTDDLSVSDASDTTFQIRP